MGKSDLWFLSSARHLIVLNTCVKFHENISNGFLVTEQAGKHDRQTKGKTICLPYPSGVGDIIRLNKNGCLPCQNYYCKRKVLKCNLLIYWIQQNKSALFVNDRMITFFFSFLFMIFCPEIVSWAPGILTRTTE